MFFPGNSRFTSLKESSSSFNVSIAVFEGELLESQAIKLKSELDTYIRQNKDSVILFKSRSKRWMEKEFLGMIEDDKTDNFL